MEFLSTLIIAVLITSLLIPLLKRMALTYNLVDIPNERKVHSQPIPRVGGIAIALGVFVPLTFWEWRDGFVQAYLLSALVLCAFGLADDLRDLSPLWKLVGQAAAAAIIMSMGNLRIVTLGSLLPDGVTTPSWLLLLLTLITIVGVTNAINLADGLDGLAGGISLLCIATIGLLAWQEGDTILGLIAVALCGAIFGFLRYNTFPASIFMGDTGSQLLGFSAITLGLSLTQGDTPLSPVVPLLILGFPVLDTLTVMTGRIVHKRSPFSADKSHFHHSLLKLGFRQAESVLIIYVIQVTLILLVYYFRFYSDWLLLSGYLLFSTVVLAIFAFARGTAWGQNRSDLLNNVNDYLRSLREKTIIVTFLFQGLCLLYPGMLVVTLAISGPTSGDAALTAIGLLLLLAVAGYFRTSNFNPQMIRFITLILPSGFKSLVTGILYLIVPYGVYFSEQWMASQSLVVFRGYNILFGLLALLYVLVSKLSRRAHGFKSTPLDFLIIILALAPLLAAASLPDFHLGLVAAKIFVLYYGCEVLMTELRKNYTVLTGGVVAALVTLVIRWFV